jgi:hypothetical protein
MGLGHSLKRTMCYLGSQLHIHVTIYNAAIHCRCDQCQRHVLLAVAARYPKTGMSIDGLSSSDGYKWGRLT